VIAIYAVYPSTLKTASYREHGGLRTCPHTWLVEKIGDVVAHGITKLTADQYRCLFPLHVDAEVASDGTYFCESSMNYVAEALKPLARRTHFGDTEGDPINLHPEKQID